MKKFENSHTNASGVFPDTLAIDASGPSTTDGTEYIAEGINEWWGWSQALLDDVGIIPSGVTEVKGASDILDGTKKLIGGKKIEPLLAVPAANALTITLNPTYLDFRSATLGSGAVEHVRVPSAISVVISSGSKAGTVDGIQSQIAVIAINNAGTVELAFINLAGGNNLDETDRITTVAEGGAGAADAANVFYSGTLRTNVAYKVVGYIESTQATAGAWATAPSTIQGAGGQAFSAMASLGYGQTWGTVARVSGTTYYNDTGKPISVNCSAVVGANAIGINTVTINGGTPFTFLRAGGATVGQNTGAGQTIIPPGASYVFTETNLSTVVYTELR